MGMLLLMLMLLACTLLLAGKWPGEGGAWHMRLVTE
jgi:hypothetical protein